MRSSPDLIRIVIADDHRIVRDGLRHLLHTQPDFHVVGEAIDGIEAVRLARELRPSVLLLDVSMPRSSGLDALRELATAPSPVHAMLLTATIERSDTVKALQLGARGVVLKDSPPELLYKSIRMVMAGQLWVGHETVSDLLHAVRHPHAADSSAATFGLTARQLEIVAYVVGGLTNKEIAHELSISEQTVKHHLSGIFDKTGVSSRVELAMFAAHHRLLDFVTPPSPPIERTG